ncbi:amidohydrolase family protein [Jiangella muralis]|uniref:amidohydrolase family protein n=1 Tax=Jiangella muralis TaxID=702383 RepID=UPI00069D7562|nr:amidohydrolase [Jiangella muralis]
MYTLLIRNVTAVDPGDDATRVLPEHDIAITGGRIAAIQPAGRVQSDEADEIIDGTGMAALPGLINAHAHTAMTLFRGSAEDVPIDEWFNDYVWSMETNLTPDDVAWGARLGIAEMIAGGVTTVADHYIEMDVIAEAAEAGGIRAHLAPTMFGADPRAELAAAEAFAGRWHRAAGGRIQAWLGPHAPYTCPPDFLREVAREANRLGLGCHIHVSESAAQVDASLAAHGVTPIGLLQRLGLTDGRLLCAHATHATPDDIALLAASGAGVAHCPKTFLKLASGIAPVTAMRAAGVPVGLGSDGAASNNTLDILEQLRLAAMLQKHELHDARALPLHSALAMATSAGAQALGQGHELGRLLPGYLADVILLRLDRTHVQPVHDVSAALVYAARAGDVDTTIVDGRVLMRRRRLLTLDETEIMREVGGRAERLRQRGHGRTMQTYST